MRERTTIRHDSGFANAIIAVAGGVAVLFGLFGVVYAAASCEDTPPPAGRVYVSLGDSVAAGNGASDAATSSFAALLSAREGVPLYNVAKAGATTQDVLDKQLAPALTVVNADRAAFVTISAGGNDLATLIPNASCVQEPLPASCPLAETLSGVEARLDTIVKHLRDANSRVPIVLLAYPNFFSGTGHPFDAPAGRVLPRLDDVIRRVAARYDHVAVAEAAPPFEGRGGELTHVLDPQFDPHPNDAGHRIIAEAFEAALRRTRKG